MVLLRSCAEGALAGALAGLLATGLLLGLDVGHIRDMMLGDPAGWLAFLLLASSLSGSFGLAAIFTALLGAE